MDKIVITTAHTESDDYVIRSLNLLFPDCAIEIVNKNSGIKNIYSFDSMDNKHRELPQLTEKLANF